MEVKTVKTRKSTDWCKIFPKSASPRLEMRFIKNSKTQNNPQALGYMLVFEII